MQHNHKAEIQQAVKDIHTLMHSGAIPQCNPEEMMTLTDIVQENGSYNPSVNRLYEVIHKLLEQLEKVIFRNNNANYMSMSKELKEEIQDMVHKEVKAQLSNLLKKQ